LARTRGFRRAHRQDIRPGVEEADLAHELRRAERAVHQPFARPRIDDLDLSFEDIDEPVHRIARLDHHLACGIAALAPDAMQRGHVAFGQGDARHGFEIFAQCFHDLSPSRRIATRPVLP
jgi:hypothetical protein